MSKKRPKCPNCGEYLYRFYSDVTNYNKLGYFCKTCGLYKDYSGKLKHKYDGPLYIGLKTVEEVIANET